MERIALDSTNIVSAGFDLESGTLEIEFHSGGVYQYFDVPEALYDELVGADSPDGFLHDRIRGAFRYARV